MLFLRTSLRRSFRRLRLVAQGLFVVLCVLTSESKANGDDLALEYKVKAGYLFNFARFIEWPPEAFAAPASPFVIGVLDGGEASPVLRLLFAGKKINDRPIEVRSIVGNDLGEAVHILLVTRAAQRTPEEVRQLCGTRSVLIVGETDEFAERGGAIGFVRVEESVRLSLCLEHANARGLKVSAKLASVAKSVKSKRGS